MSLTYSQQRPITTENPGRAAQGYMLNESFRSILTSPTPLVAYWDSTLAQLVLYFSGAAYSVDTSKLSLAVPDGAAAVTISSAVISGNAILLTLSSSPVLGTYTLTLLASAMVSTTGTPSAAGTLTFSGVDTSAPSIANITPAVGTKLQPTDSIQLDVLDANLRSVTVLAKFPTTGKLEVVYYNDPTGGATIGPDYDGTIAVITGGKRLNFTRRKGWLAAPSFIVDSVDTAGNS
jgi:hypothetical protein